jgi:hypothetical protein
MSDEGRVVVKGTLATFARIYVDAVASATREEKIAALEDLLGKVWEHGAIEGASRGVIGWTEGR